ncbi:MAG TPA: DEAD/DEAH box helicase [Gemmatimonadaceae bacterium]|nr:DEAD/DEAH box helicase [Gemmatimonadaceae bacterium]
MGRRVIVADGAAVKAAIAQHWLGRANGGSAPSLGDITLRPHQRDAVQRLRKVLHRHRVALLADDVGLGKTYVAAALAGEFRAPLIVAPAALRGMWRDALSAANVEAPCISYEQLSRGAAPEAPYDLVILDEAQHARTPSTRRYRHLAAIVGGARLLLLSATPIHNRRDDLVALFSLVLGRAARSLDDTGIAARTVRRMHGDVSDVRLPAVEEEGWIAVPDDDTMLQALLDLAPPLAPRGGGDGGALLTWTLVRLWASTRGALRAALRRRLHRGWALRQALECGVFPSREELAAWQCSDAALQLGFPQLLAPPAAGSGELLEFVDNHLVAVEKVLAKLALTPDPDAARVARLRELYNSSPGARVLVFTQFVDSARAIWRLMRDDPGVAVLTSRGAEVAGGTISRREALSRFAPQASGFTAPPRAQAIELLISTDLLSEGVNLQDASVVVHLDLPWTYARLAQRVGRVRRMGSPHARVRIFTFAPPAPAERLLAVERRIAEKLNASARTLGIAGAILPPAFHTAAAHGDRAPAHSLERLRSLVDAWRAPDGSELPPGAPVAAVASGCDRTGSLAAVRDFTGAVILAVTIDGVTSDDPRALLDMAERINLVAVWQRDARTSLECPNEPFEGLVSHERERIERWCRARAADYAAGGTISIVGVGRRRALRRLAAILARTPLSRRHEIAAVAARARQVANTTIGAAGEVVLGELAAAPMPDDAWLRAVAAFAEARRGDSRTPATTGLESRVLAMIVMLATNARGFTGR